MLSDTIYLFKPFLNYDTLLICSGILSHKKEAAAILNVNNS